MVLPIITLQNLSKSNNKFYQPRPYRTLPNQRDRNIVKGLNNLESITRKNNKISVERNKVREIREREKKRETIENETKENETRSKQLSNAKLLSLSCTPQNLSSQSPLKSRESRNSRREEEDKKQLEGRDKIDRGESTSNLKNSGQQQKDLLIACSDQDKNIQFYANYLKQQQKQYNLYHSKLQKSKKFLREQSISSKNQPVRLRRKNKTETQHNVVDKDRDIEESTSLSDSLSLSNSNLNNNVNSEYRANHFSASNRLPEGFNPEFRQPRLGSLSSNKTMPNSHSITKKPSPPTRSIFSMRKINHSDECNSVKKVVKNFQSETQHKTGGAVTRSKSLRTSAKSHNQEYYLSSVNNSLLKISTHHLKQINLEEKNKNTKNGINSHSYSSITIANNNNPYPIGSNNNTKNATKSNKNTKILNTKDCKVFVAEQGNISENANLPENSQEKVKQSIHNPFKRSRSSFRDKSNSESNEKLSEQARSKSFSSHNCSRSSPNNQSSSMNPNYEQVNPTHTNFHMSRDGMLTKNAVQNVSKSSSKNVNNETDCVLKHSSIISPKHQPTPILTIPPTPTLTKFYLGKFCTFCFRALSSGHKSFKKCIQKFPLISNLLKHPRKLSKPYHIVQLQIPIVHLLPVITAQMCQLLSRKKKSPNQWISLRT